MRLSDRVRSRREQIVERWERRVIEDPAVASASRLPAPMLRDHIPEILDQLARALEANYATDEETAFGRTLGQQLLPKEYARQRAEYGDSIAAVLREVSHLRVVLIEVCALEADWDVPGIRLLHGALDECMTLAAVEMERLAIARLTHAASQLQRQAETRERFFAFLSHDLRNPLSTIATASSILLTRGLVEREASFIRSISRATDHMTRMISDLLDFPRVRASKLPVVLREGDLRAVCKEVLDDFQIAQPERRILLRQEGKAVALLDSDYIAQVLTNLVGNALAYSPADTIDEGIVTVTLRERGNEVLLDVHNSGPKIPDDELPHVFEAFRRRKRGAVDTNRAGLGLGLSIAKEIVEAHGGRISVESSDEGGTIFSASFRRPSNAARPTSLS